MSTSTSVAEAYPFRTTHPASRVATTLEVLLVYAGILLYIWRWQFTHPHFWIILLGVIFASHIAHGDTPRALGLSLHGLRENAQTVLPLVAAVYLPLLFLGFARHTLVIPSPAKQTLFSFLSYGSWCAVQQYLAQSYFHHRLRSVVRSPHLSSLMVGVMFGGAHIPNPILMGVTTLGGFLLAEVYARHRNIWPLALAQAVGGFLVAVLSPASVIHNMRVGPGYFFFGIR